MNRICSRCKEEKPDDEFIFKNKSKNIKHNECVKCRKIYRKAHYKRNKQYYIEKASRHTKEKVKQFQNWKSLQKCIVCGESESICLDFHHREMEDKKMEISQIVRKHSVKKLIEELKKCVCVRANCHRKIHADIIPSPYGEMDISQLCEG